MSIKYVSTVQSLAGDANFRFLRFVRLSHSFCSLAVAFSSKFGCSRLLRFATGCAFRFIKQGFNKRDMVLDYSIITITAAKPST